MAKEQRRPSPDAKSPDGRHEGFVGGPRPRWTELIRQHAERHRTGVNLLKAILLVYLFLAAINMMGKGIRLTAENPEYKGEVTDATFRKPLADVEDRIRAPADLPAEDREDLVFGRRVGVVGTFKNGQGFVSFKSFVLPAVLAKGLPLHKSKVAEQTKAKIIRVDAEAGRVVIEPIPEFKDWLHDVFRCAKNPFLALLVGILITAVFQSSSFTTSFTVGLVATVDFPLACAIPVIMGANIGTSVTCVLVSLGYIRRREEFQRAFAGATVHDFFKILSCAVLFTVEQASHVLQFLASKLALMVYHGHDPRQEPTNWIKEMVRPVIAFVHWLLQDVCRLSETPTGTIMALLAVVLLFVALLLLVKVLKDLILKRAEGLFDRVLFRNPPVAFLVGLVLTAAVQSSSVTTSLAVPLIAAGLLSIRQVFPYFLGANIGTTVTALLAAFATGAATEEGARLGLTLACVHVLFNVIGATIFYPLRWIPIALAEGLAQKAAQSKRYAVYFILGVFFGIPLLGIALHALYVRLFAS